MGGMTKNPLAGLAALGLAGMAPTNQSGLNPTGKFLLLSHILRYSFQFKYIENGKFFLFIL